MAGKPLHLNASAQMHAQIEALCASMDLNKTDVVTRAVKVLHFLESERRRGRRLYTADPDGEGVREVVTL